MTEPQRDPVFIFEDIASVPKIRLGTFLGVRITATKIAWLGVVAILAISMGSAFLIPELEDTGERLWIGFVLWVSLQSMIFIHSLGHILGGKMVGAPMDELLITLTRQVNIYHGTQDKYPARVHLGRAMGGLTLNLLVAAICIYVGGFTQVTYGRELILWAGVFNLVFGLGSFIPVRSVDGEVIWRELFRL